MAGLQRMFFIGYYQLLKVCFGLRLCKNSDSKFSVGAAAIKIMMFHKLVARLPQNYDFFLMLVGNYFDLIM